MTTSDHPFEQIPASLPDLGGDELESLLAKATHVARNAICITDAVLNEPGPHIVYVNPAFERMTGYTAAEVIGRNPRFLQGPRSDRRVLDRLRADLEAGRPFEGETFNYRKDGTAFTMAWRVAAVTDATGTPTHYIAAQDDLTELRAAEQDLRSLASQLQATLLPDLSGFHELELAWRYRPTATHAFVGGDWYDAVRTPNGSVALFLGDMVGHGDEAAALMGEFRFLVRGLVRAFDDPGRILDELELAVLADRSPGQAMATIVAAIVSPEGTVRYSVAGHPAPVVRRATGGVEPLEAGRSRLIGASPSETPRPTATAQLGPDDVLVAFSDGAFERRGHDVDHTYGLLLDRLRVAGPEPVEQCIAAISVPSLDEADEHPTDDIVVIAARRSRA